MSKVVGDHDDLLTQWGYVHLYKWVNTKQILFLYKLPLTTSDSTNIELIFSNKVLQKLNVLWNDTYSSMKKYFRKLQIILDIENWLWKSEFCKLLRTRSRLYQKIIWLEFTVGLRSVYFLFSGYECTTIWKFWIGKF